MSLAACALILASAAPSQVATFDSHGVKIRYAVTGAGTPLVLIHGWMGDATTWGRDKLGNPAPSAVEGYQTIAIDCRGHGASDKPQDGAAYGAEMALDVVRLLDHLNVKKAHVLGYSMGTFLAGYIVAKHPDRVISVVYGGQAPLLRGKDDGGSAEVDAFAKAVEDSRLGDYFLFATPASRPKPTPEQAETMAKVMFTGKDVKALAAAGKSFPKLAVRLTALRKAAVPTLFVYGAKEPDSLKRRVADLVATLPGAEVKEIPGADHVSTLGNPAFGASVMEFFGEHR